MRTRTALTTWTEYNRDAHLTEQHEICGVIVPTGTHAVACEDPGAGPTVLAFVGFHPSHLRLRRGRVGDR
eukprot:5141656-Prymnesium_polylepis.1